jgi:hypothetical protein
MVVIVALYPECLVARPKGPVVEHRRDRSLRPADDPD